MPTISRDYVVGCLRSPVVAYDRVGTMFSSQEINHTAFSSITKTKITNHNCLAFSQGFLLFGRNKKVGNPASQSET